MLVFLRLFSSLLNLLIWHWLTKIIQVSGAQFYITSSVHCTVYLLPQVKLPCITIYPPRPHVCFHELFLYFFSLNSSTPCLENGQPALYGSVSILLLSLFCSLDFTYEVSSFFSLDSTSEETIFLWLAY